mgnify:FL=1
MPTLVLQRNDSVLGTYVMSGDPVTVGRSRDNTISIVSSGVSRHHCRIEQSGVSFVLTDLGSLNGTFVNGSRAKRVRLSHGDGIAVATYVILFKEQPAAAASPASGRSSPLRIEDDDQAAGDRPEVTSVSPGGGPNTVLMQAQSSHGPGPDTELKIDSALIDSDLLVVRVTLRGPIDQNNAKRLPRLFDPLFADGTFNVLLEMSEVPFIGSTGWGALLRQLKRVQQDGHAIKLVHLSRKVAEQARLLALDKLFGVYPSEEAALKAFQSEAGPAESEAPPEKSGDERKPPLEAASPASQATPSRAPQAPPPPARETGGEEQPGRRGAEQPAVDKWDLPLEQKIKSIIMEDPLGDERRIRRRLSDPDYGSEKIGRFKLRSLLKVMNLDTKLKRYQFFKIS